MKEYILAVCGAVVIAALISLLLPSGKTGRFIGGILKLFCLLVMLVPLFRMFGNFVLPDAEKPAAAYGPDEEFIRYVCEQQAQARAEEVEKAVEEKFSVDVSVEVEWEYAEYSCNVTEISVKIEDFGIYGNEGHIYVIQQIDSYVSSFSKEAEVNVYE